MDRTSPPKLRLFTPVATPNHKSPVGFGLVQCRTAVRVGRAVSRRRRAQGSHARISHAGMCHVHVRSMTMCARKETRMYHKITQGIHLTRGRQSAGGLLPSLRATPHLLDRLFNSNIVGAYTASASHSSHIASAITWCVGPSHSDSLRSWRGRRPRHKRQAGKAWPAISTRTHDPRMQSTEHTSAQHSPCADLANARQRAALWLQWQPERQLAVAPKL